MVGVHTPEFPFEHDVENVRWAAKDMTVEYPVAIDSDYAIWRAFGNRYWPAVYIADAEGRIRHHQFGEGGYEECERVIQGLLREAGGEGIADDLVTVAGDGFEAQADWTNLEISRDATSATSKPRTLRLPVVPSSTSLAPTSRRIRCGSTSGLYPGTGRSRAGRAC